jgi:hypothetical protein
MLVNALSACKVRVDCLHMHDRLGDSVLVGIVSASLLASIPSIISKFDRLQLCYMPCKNVKMSYAAREVVLYIPLRRPQIVYTFRPT